MGVAHAHRLSPSRGSEEAPQTCFGVFGPIQWEGSGHISLSQSEADFTIAIVRIGIVTRSTKECLFASFRLAYDIC